jgi:diadenylate cyclase
MSNALWTILDNVRIQDLLDIVIISALIYVILVWFEKAASRFVLVGIGLLGAVYILSRVFELYLTAVVLQAFFAVLLVALVVIFQEELRRFFERLATWAKIRNRAYGSVYHRDVDVITLSVINLAQKRVGALIVVQGDDPLARHIEGGTRLDGILSQSILDSIFDPHSLGHDGAVVIDRGRVVYYGCHLPLSLNPQKIQGRGLRHTAALGLAERSDALCIVVSEERGSISVAQEGRLVSLPGGQELKSILEAFYAKRAPKKESRPFSDLMKKDFGKKATAVLLAATLWSVFGYQKESIRRDFVIPVEYRNLGTEWMIEGPRVTEATVMLSGPEQAFRLLDPQTLKVSVDLSRIGEGEQSVEFTRDAVKIPSNLSLEGIKPERILLTAHRLLPTEVPVEVVTEGNLRTGYTLERIEATPPLVKVLVPSSLSRKGLKIRTESIGLDQLTQTTTVTTKLLLPSEVRLIDGKPLGVKVTIFIQPSPLRIPLKQSS